MKNKILITLILTVLFLIPLVSSWNTFQNTQDRLGWDPTGIGRYNETGNVITTVTVGEDFQPLIFDADGDGTDEIFITSTTNLQTYTVSNRVLQAELSVVMDGSQASPLTVLTSYDSDAFAEFVVLTTANNLTVYEHNGTSLNVEVTIDLPGTIRVAPVCGNFSTSDVYCVLANNTGGIITVNFSTNLTSGINISSSDVFNTVQGLLQTIPLSQLDSVGGVNDLVFYADPDSDGNEGAIAWDFGTKTIIWSINDMGSSLAENVDGILIANLNNDVGGANEVAFTYHHEGGAGARDGFMTARNGQTGGLFASWGGNANIEICDNNGDTTSTCYMSPPVFSTRDAVFQVCSIGVKESSSTNDQTTVNCQNAASGGNQFNNVSPSADGNDNLYYDNGRPVVAATMTTTSGTNFDLVTGSHILTLTGTGAAMRAINYTTASPTNERTAYPALQDVDGDGILDIVTQRSGQLLVAFSNFTNGVPTLNNSLTNGGYGSAPGVLAPICVNTTVTFSATECGSVPCNYFNDIVQDTERLATNCGQGANGFPTGSSTDGLENGTLDITRPNFECFFNQTGLFSVTIFLQDDANLGDETQFNTVPLLANVIVGQDGVTCNTGVSIPAGATGATPTGLLPAQEESIAEMWDILFGADTRIRAIVGLGIALGIGVFVLLMGGGVVGFAGTVVLLTGMLALSGLFSFWIFILMFVTMALLVFVGNALGVGGGNMGGGGMSSPKAP